MSIYRAETHDEDGRPKVFVTNKKVGTTTFFSSRDESDPVHEIVFNMRSNGNGGFDATKSVDLYFNQDIYMIGGDIEYVNAPLGANMAIEVHLTGYGKIASYGDAITFLGTNGKTFISQDRDVIYAPTGQMELFMRIICRNSDPENFSEHDPRCAFKFCGNLYTYRAVTV